MNREWAAILADKFDTGELLWTTGTFVTTSKTNNNTPCFCVMGAMALDVGAVVRHKECGTCSPGTDCLYSKHRLESQAFRQNPIFVERLDDLASWLEDRNDYSYEASMSSEHVVSEMNDGACDSVADLVQVLRDFSSE